MRTGETESQSWQCHGIGLDVRHAVTSKEPAIKLQKESNSLRKGAGGSDALNWGLVEMVLWSVHGRSCFFVIFCFSIL
jgi:hypothetical protein